MYSIGIDTGGTYTDAAIVNLSTGAVVASLRRTPSTSPFWVAFFISLAWIFVVAAIFGPTILSPAQGASND